MERHECNKHRVFIYINNSLEFYFLVKIRVLQTYPLNMDLVLEIRMDQKRNLETLPSTLLLFPK
jgi:hypothetical protein